MRKIAFIMIVLTILQGSLFGQQLLTPRLIPLVFDSSGKMIRFPPPVIRRSERFSFSVKISTSYVQAGLNTMAAILKKAADMPGASFDCFLSGSDYKKLFSTAADALKDVKLCNDAAIAKLKLFNTQTLGAFGADTALLPVQLFVAYQLDSLLEYKIYNGSKLVCSDYLRFDHTNCDNKCITFSAPPTPRVFNLLTGACSTCTADSLSFQVIMHDPVNSAITRWIQLQQPAVQIDKTTFKQDFSNWSAALDANKSDVCKLQEKVKADLASVFNWTARWLWLTKGVPVINPFPRFTRKKVSELLEGVNNDKNKLIHTRESLAYNDSCKRKLTQGFNNFDTLTLLQAREDSLKLVIKTDSTIIAGSQLAIDTSFNAYAKYASSSQVMYKGTVMISRVAKVRVQKQFDAASGYDPVYKNRRQRERISEVPDNEKVFIIIHNQDSASLSKIDEKRVNFEDQEEFTQLLNDQISKIDFSSFTPALLNNVKNTFSALSDKTFGLSPEQPKQPLEKLPVCYCATLFSYAKAITTRLVDNPDIAVLPETDIFNNAVKSKPLYSSQLLPLTQFETPFRDSITIKQIVKKDSATDKAKTYVKVGLLRYFQLGAGVAFVNHPVSTTSIDTTGNGFKVSTTDNIATPVLGIKLYPVRNYNRDKGLLPRYPFRRLSVFGGFDLLHPLNNFYVGGGYDIVPGLTFIAGNNFYLQTNYTVQNSQIVHTAKAYKSGGLFYSVTVNPILFVQFVKLFFK